MRFDGSSIHLGRPQVRPSAPAHTAGVREGNWRAWFMREIGMRAFGSLIAVATARRSTGVNARARLPIDPRMPNLTPA
jgi:hypothetical protein